MRPSRLARLVVLSAFLCLSWVAHAAPFVPSDDNEIVERLPLSATDPSVRRVDSLRKQIDAQPGNTGLRIELARRYFDLAGAQGDPRYVGYAQAALRPLAGVAESNPNYWLVLGMLQQYSHDFAGALTSLNRANQIDPQLAEPMAWRAAIYMVQARYPEALAECEKLPAYVHPLFATGCSAYVRATTGALAASFETLRNAVDTAKGAPPELVLWELNRLADMALRLQQPDLAGNLFQRALKIGVKMAFGTDSGVSPHGVNAQEFALLVASGMTPAQALKTAGPAAADLLGLADRIGTIETGKEVQQRAFPRAGRPHQAEEFARSDIETDVVQHRHDLVAAPVGFAEIADFDDEACHECSASSA